MTAVSGEIRSRSGTGFARVRVFLAIVRDATRRPARWLRKKGQRPLPVVVGAGRNGIVKRIHALGGTGMLTLGLALVVLGLVTDGIAVAAVGVIALLTGLYARSRQA